MKAYIINLKSSTDRKAYMEQVMNPVSPFLDYEFIDAVDGRAMSDDDIRKSINQTKTYQMYGRELRAGEIGCTLSHKKCAQMLLDSDNSCALVLEDDLIWRHTEDLESVLSAIERLMDTEKPLITLLSGDYWYTSLYKLKDQYRIASVRDAVCTQAYVVNRAAAQKLLNLENWHVADDWWAIKKQGITIKAVFPHMADQNRADIHTSIAEIYGGIIKKNIAFTRRIYLMYLSFIKKMLVYSKHFEAKSFKWSDSK